ncbi:MAG: Gfo/Idh/MocA family protein, partial [Phycisphaerales bacterium]
MHRRAFLATVPAVLAAPTLLGAAARAASAAAAPTILRGSEPPVRIALIGCSGRGADNLGDLLGAGAEIVALCDVDSRAREAGAKRCPKAAVFRDLRELFKARRELALDGVLVSTPDHTHAFPTALALRAGLPVYCEKPLTHTMEESRRIGELAAKAKVPTQMGTQIHATENYRRVVEQLRAGAIGRVTSCDCWVNKGWCCGPTGPVSTPPAELDYDLWLGPAQETPFVTGVHPANWRKYWDFGTGTLGDMGCHMMDLPVWALGLDRAALGTVEIHASTASVDSVACPEWTEASWAIPQKDFDPLVLRWFDNGRISPTAQELGAKDRVDYHGRFNMVFQGTKGFLWANYGEHLVTPGVVAAEGPAKAESIAPSPGHHREWLDAIRAWRAGTAGAYDAPLCAFARSTVLNEIVLSGTVAGRAQAPVRYDFNARAFVGGDPIAHWHPAPRAGGARSAAARARARP